MYFMFHREHFFAQKYFHPLSILIVVIAFPYKKARLEYPPQGTWEPGFYDPS
jgi:hypothetical protein